MSAEFTGQLERSLAAFPGALEGLWVATVTSNVDGELAVLLEGLRTIRLRTLQRRASMQDRVNRQCFRTLQVEDEYINTGQGESASGHCR